MIKFTTIIFLIVILSGCKCSKEEKNVHNSILENKSAKLEKIDEIKIEETDSILIGLIYLFEFNSIEKTILISDPIFCELKIYSDKGKFIKKIGKKGDGPGEFRRIMGIAKDINYYYTTDDVLRRFSIFTKDGLYIKSFPIPTSIALDPGEIIIYKSKIYVNSWQMQYHPMNEVYKSKQIAVLDTNGNILYHFGNYDDIYRKYKLLWTSPRFDMDEEGNTYLSSYLSWKIFKYDGDGNFKKSFGIKGSSFNEVKENIRGDETLEKLNELAIRYSHVPIIKYGKNYVYLQYSNLNKNFHKIRSKMNKEHFLIIYTKYGKYIKSDIKLPGGGMLDVDDEGIIYIELSDEPGNRIIGKYKINIVDED
jgi:hypothetical protein